MSRKQNSSEEYITNTVLRDIILRVSINADRYLAITALSLSILLVVYLLAFTSRSVYLVPAIGIGVVSVIWLATRSRISTLDLSALEGPETPENKQSVKLLNSIFFIILSIYILYAHQLAELGQRSVIHFIVISMLSGLIAVEIIYTPLKRRDIILTKIILLSLLIILPQILNYANPIGIDPWYHQKVTLELLSINRVPQGYGYSALPLFHILSSISMLIPNLDYKLSTLFSISLISTICNILWIYLLSNEVFKNYQIGLFGSLLIALADEQIYFSMQPIPNTLAITFLLPFLYCILKLRSHPHSIVPIFSILAISIILTHSLSSLIVFVILIVFFIIPQIYNYTYNTKKDRVSIYILLFWSIFMITWWSYVSGHFNWFMNMSESFFAVEYLGGTDIRDVNYMNTVSFSEQLVNNTGFFSFFLLATFGTFYVLRVKRNAWSLSIVASGTVVLAIGFLSILTPISLVESRWFFVAQVLLCIPASISILLVNKIKQNSFESKKIKAIIIVTMIVLLSFSLSINAHSNIEHTPYLSETGVRYALTHSEVRAVNHINEINPESNIYTDQYYCVCVHLGIPLELICSSLIEKSFGNCEGIILIRDEILRNPFLLYGKPYMLEYNPLEVLEKEHISEVYTCGSVLGFINSDSRP